MEQPPENRRLFTRKHRFTWGDVRKRLSNRRKRPRRLRPARARRRVENILLEAANIGLGAVWFGIAPSRDRIAAVDVALGSPRGVEPFALVAVGHPQHRPESKGATRYDETRVHWI